MKASIQSFVFALIALLSAPSFAAASVEFPSKLSCSLSTYTPRPLQILDSKEFEVIPNPDSKPKTIVNKVTGTRFVILASTNEAASLSVSAIPEGAKRAQVVTWAVLAKRTYLRQMVVHKGYVQDFICHSNE